MRFAGDMKRTIALLAFLTTTQPHALKPEVSPQPIPYTLPEIIEKYERIGPARNSQKTCSGFSLNEALVYTAGHCTDGEMYDAQAAALQRVGIYLPGDVALLRRATASPRDRGDIPLWPEELHPGDKVAVFTSVSPAERASFIERYPTQAAAVGPLLSLSGLVNQAASSVAIVDQACRPTLLSLIYRVAIPGRQGFSGSPVFVEEQGSYFLAGIVVAMQGPSLTSCGRPASSEEALYFSGVSNLLALHELLITYSSSR